MHGRKWRLLLAVAVLALAILAGCGGGAPKVDWQIDISGNVEKPLSVSYAELAKMPPTELKDILMQKSRGEDEVHSFTGVALTELFARAGAGEVTLLTAIAGDGYAVEISKDELAEAMVALKQDGEWIAKDKDHGPVRLVCPHTPANRWVFQLQTLQIE